MPTLPWDDLAAHPSDYIRNDFFPANVQVARPELMPSGALYTFISHIQGLQHSSSSATESFGFHKKEDILAFINSRKIEDDLPDGTVIAPRSSPAPSLVLSDPESDFHSPPLGDSDDVTHLDGDSGPGSDRGRGRRRGQGRGRGRGRGRGQGRRKVDIHEASSQLESDNTQSQGAEGNQETGRERGRGRGRGHEHGQGGREVDSHKASSKPESDSAQIQGAEGNQETATAMNVTKKRKQPETPSGEDKPSKRSKQ